MFKWIKNKGVHSSRVMKILFHRYLIFSFLAFILSHELVYCEAGSLDGFRVCCAVIAFVFIAIVLGMRDLLYTFFIGLGLLTSVTYYHRAGLLYFSPNAYEIFVYVYTLVLWILSPILIGLRFSKDHDRKVLDKLMSRGDLYPERLSAFDAISEYISSHSVIGINSPFGNGKSTVVEALRRQKTEWEFITIGILSTTVENVEFCIIRELSRVLESYGIFSNPVSKIKSVFSHDFAYCVGDLLFDSPSYEDQIKNFVEDIRRLNRVVVLNFEDIDRITDKTHLNKIFSICDSMLKCEQKMDSTSHSIKIIYQCNKDALDDLFKDEFGGQRYVEKYIPHFVCLRELTGEFFGNVLFQNPQKYEKLKKVSFVFLDNAFRNKFFDQRIRLSLVGHTIRGVEQILDKVNSAFEMYEDISVEKQEEFEAVLIFNIMQYFFPHVYALLGASVEMHKQKIFYYKKDDSLISLLELCELLKNYESNRGIIINQFFDDEVYVKAKENRAALLFLMLLGYNDEIPMEENQIPNEITRRKCFIVCRLLKLHS